MVIQKIQLGSWSGDSNERYAPWIILRVSDWLEIHHFVMSEKSGRLDQAPDLTLHYSEAAFHSKSWDYWDFLSRTRIHVTDSLI